MQKIEEKNKRPLESLIRRFAKDARFRAYLADRLKNERGLCLETPKEIRGFLCDVEFTLRAMREFVA